jgi:hypothetical protein
LRCPCYGSQSGPLSPSSSKLFSYTARPAQERRHLTLRREFYLSACGNLTAPRGHVAAWAGRADSCSQSRAPCHQCGSDAGAEGGVKAGSRLAIRSSQVPALNSTGSRFTDLGDRCEPCNLQRALVPRMSGYRTSECHLCL